MNYPLISEYVQSIRFSEENFDKLSNLCPVLDEDGNPVMFSGNFAIVFKMQDKQTGKLHAVKCFLREQEGREESYKLIASELEYVSSTLLTPIQYLEKEIFVDTTQGEDTEFPVLLMDWVEGLTLDKYIRNNIHDPYKLALITYQFCRMGSWLLSQEFAHGDLKPDNIIVREDGQLVLVDYDGMFVPAMKGQNARELGSVDYCHPLRTKDVFNGSIDDFSIASIALSLKAISLKPELLNDFGAEDRLLFSAKDYQNIGESECLKAIQSLSNDAELAQLLGLFYIAYARNELSNVSFKLFNISKPEYVTEIAPELEFSTRVTDEDLADAIVDEYGVKYSRDGLRLLKAPRFIERYKIKDGTKIICNRAFIRCHLLHELVIPSSVTSISNVAFCGCTSLHLRLNSSKFELLDNSIIIDVKKKEILSCINNKNNIIIPSSITSIGSHAFYGRHLYELVIPSSVTSIGHGAFIGCHLLHELVIPSSVIRIGDAAFNDCSLLQLDIKSSKFELFDNSIIIDVKTKRVLSCINNKSNIIIPPYVTSIGRCAFLRCRSLRELFIPSSVTEIGYGVFEGCESLQSIIVPKGQTERFSELLKNAGCDLSIIKEQDE